MSSPAADPQLDPAREPTPAPPLRNGRRGRFRRLRFPLLVVFGAAAGLAANMALGKTKPDESHAHAAATPHEPEPPAETVGKRIDTAIETGLFANALKMLKAAPEAFGDEAAHHYREALALEGLGQWKDAAAAYQKAAHPNADTGEWARVTLGQARCAAATGDLKTARNLLNRVALRSGDPHAGGNVLGECLHLRARLAFLELHPHAGPDPLDETAPVFPPLDGGIDQYLAWLPPGHGHTSPTTEEGERAKSVTAHRSRWLPGLTWVSAHVPGTPLADTVAEIVTAAGLTLRADADATKRLADAGAVRLDVDHAPLAEVLAALTEPLGLACRVEGDALVIHPAGPHHPPELRDAAREAARRLLAFAPDHPRGRAVRVAAATLDFEDRKREAGNAYRQFLDDEPNAAEGVYAAHNLGLIELQAGNLGPSRAMFLQVVDRDPRGPWAGIGWWWVARTYLDEGDAVAAKKPLDNAAEKASKELASAVRLGVCFTHLLTGDDDAARSLLRTTRFASRPAHLGTANWFAALLRYRVSPSDKRAEEARAALHDGGEGRPLGRAGVYFAGRAYREIGQPERMAAVYEAEAETARGPLAVRMTFDVAEYLYRLDRRGPARQRYLTVAAADPAGLGWAAEVRVAELAAREGQGGECVRRCRRAAKLPGAQMEPLLRVMGRGFELEGEYALAAECFAGRLPAE